MSSTHHNLTPSLMTIKPIIFSSLALAIIIPNLIFILGIFPYFGLFLSLVTVTGLLFVARDHKDKYRLALFIFTILFSCFLIIRANIFLSLLNFISIVYLLSIICLGVATQSLFKLLLSPLYLIKSALKITSPVKLNAKLYKLNISDKTLFSIVVTVIILIIILPLLSFANPIFGHWISTIFSFIVNLEFLQSIDPNILLIALSRLTLALILILLLPKLTVLVNKNQTKTNPFRILNFPLLIPKISVILVLFIFFITQFQLYFSSNLTLESLGYTHSRYAREVFAQLSIVFIIVFALIYNDKAKTKYAQLSSFILALQLFFLNLISLKSVWDYSYMWGLTEKRLYGFSVVIWLFGILILFIYHYLKKHISAVFIKNGLLFSCLILLAINLLNFDYLIFHMAKSRTGEGIDHLYLARLSVDSGALGEHFLYLTDVIKSENANYEEHNWKIREASQRELRTIKQLTEIYQHFDLRAFNVSQYLAYQSVKDLDLEFYDQMINTAYRKIETMPLSVQPPVQNDIMLHSAKFAKATLMPLPQQKLSPISVSISIPEQIYPQTISAQINPSISVKLVNLDPIYRNTNLQIKKDGELVTDNLSLDTDSYWHHFGTGQYSVVVMKYDGKGNYVFGKKFNYKIDDDTKSVEIDFNQ